MATDSRCNEAFELQAIPVEGPSISVIASEPSTLTLSNVEETTPTTPCADVNDDQAAPCVRPTTCSTSTSSPPTIASSTDGPDSAPGIDVTQPLPRNKWSCIEIFTSRTNTCLLTLLALITVWWAYASWREARRANYLSELAYVQAFRDDCRAQNQSRGYATAECAEVLEKPLTPPSWASGRKAKRAIESILSLRPSVFIQSLCYFVITIFCCVILKRFRSAQLALCGLLPDLYSYSISQDQYTSDSPQSWVDNHIPRTDNAIKLDQQSIEKDWSETFDYILPDTPNLPYESSSHVSEGADLEPESDEWLFTSTQITSESSVREKHGEQVSRVLQTSNSLRSAAVTPLPRINALWSCSDHLGLPYLLEYLSNRGPKQTIHEPNLSDVESDHKLGLLRELRARYFLGQAVQRGFRIQNYRSIWKISPDEVHLHRTIVWYESAMLLCNLVERGTEFRTEALQVRELIDQMYSESPFECLEQTSFESDSFEHNTQKVAKLLFFRPKLGSSCSVAHCTRCLLALRPLPSVDHGLSTEQDWATALLDDVGSEASDLVYDIFRASSEIQPPEDALSRIQDDTHLGDEESVCGSESAEEATDSVANFEALTHRFKPLRPTPDFRSELDLLLPTYSPPQTQLSQSYAPATTKERKENTFARRLTSGFLGRQGLFMQAPRYVPEQPNDQVKSRNPFQRLRKRRPR